MKPVDFFTDHPVFRYEEFVVSHNKDGRRSRLTSASVLKQHVAAGNLRHIRRGLYATVPRGLTPENIQVDPYLLASRLSSDAVIAYHAALQFHGRAYSLWNRFAYLTRRRSKRFHFRGAEFVPVQVSVAVRDLPDLGGGVLEVQRQGLAVRVTSFERSMVDVLHAHRHGGSWEEIWRSLEGVEFYDLDAVIDYALQLGCALTAARVGFYLEQHREELMVEDHHLETLAAHAPAQACYMDNRRDEPGILQSRWNLIVPESVLRRLWAEVM